MLRGLEGPSKFSDPESSSKISNLMITELFYSHILKRTEVLFIQEDLGIYTRDGGAGGGGGAEASLLSQNKFS